MCVLMIDSASKSDFGCLGSRDVSIKRCPSRNTPVTGKFSPAEGALKTLDDVIAASLERSPNGCHLF